MTRAQKWLDENGSELASLGLDGAMALIESASLHVRVVPYPSDWMSQEQRRDRINLWLAADGTVGSIDAG